MLDLRECHLHVVSCASFLLHSNRFRNGGDVCFSDSSMRPTRRVFPTRGPHQSLAEQNSRCRPQTTKTSTPSSSESEQSEQQRDSSLISLISTHSLSSITVSTCLRNCAHLRSGADSLFSVQCKVSAPPGNAKKLVS